MKDRGHGDGAVRLLLFSAACWDLGAPPSLTPGNAIRDVGVADLLHARRGGFRAGPIQSPTWELNPAQRAYQARASNQLACRQWIPQVSNLPLVLFRDVLILLS